MVGVVVVAHGLLGVELVRTANSVFGTLEQVVGVDFGFGDSEQLMQLKLEQAIKEVGTGDGVLVLVDMFGGTPSNMSLRKMEEGGIEVLAGVNLPMLLKVGNIRHDRLPELARAVRDAGTRNVLLASELLRER